MTSDLDTASALGPPVLRAIMQDTLDEFDLDVRWGELHQSGMPAGYLPTANEEPGETCDSHAATCPNTCPATCPATCQATCPATCHATCPATCRPTCPATCRDTCEQTCHLSCDGTCANTHCFTCQPNCQEP